MLDSHVLWLSCWAGIYIIGCTAITTLRPHPPATELHSFSHWYVNLNHLAAVVWESHILCLLVIGRMLLQGLQENICPEDSVSYILSKICHYLPLPTNSSLHPVTSYCPLSDLPFPWKVLEQEGSLPLSNCLLHHNILDCFNLDFVPTIAWKWLFFTHCS